MCGSGLPARIASMYLIGLEIQEMTPSARSWLFLVAMAGERSAHWHVDEVCLSSDRQAPSGLEGEFRSMTDQVVRVTVTAMVWHNRDVGDVCRFVGVIQGNEPPMSRRNPIASSSRVRVSASACLDSFSFVKRRCMSSGKSRGTVCWMNLRNSSAYSVPSRPMPNKRVAGSVPECVGSCGSPQRWIRLAGAYRPARMAATSASTP